jgi:hypothetical protein
MSNASFLSRHSRRRETMFTKTTAAVAIALALVSASNALAASAKRHAPKPQPQQQSRIMLLENGAATGSAEQLNTVDKQSGHLW